MAQMQMVWITTKYVMSCLTQLSLHRILSMRR